MLGFNNILGHEQIKEHFRNAVQTEKISHAYILSGEAGMGRKPLANTFALSLPYEKGTAKPCMQCHARRQVPSGNRPDLVYMTYERPASIGVDDIKEQINGTIQVRPYSSYYKIYVVDGAEKMTIQVQNALLKTIEKSPAYAVILLLITNQDALLPTILSRCVRLRLKPLKGSVVKEYLVQSLGESESEAGIYITFARGNLGKAIHLAQSEELGVTYREISHLLKHIKDTDISGFLDYIRKAREEDLNTREYLDLMQVWYRDILTYRTTKDVNLLIFGDESSAVKSISTTNGYDDLEKILEAIDKARIRLGASVSIELVVELMLLIMKESQSVPGLQEEENTE